VNKKRRARLIESILIFACLISFKQTSFAALEASDLAEKFREARQTVVEAEAEKRRILGSLYSINQRMKKIGVEKGQLTDELLQVQDDVHSIAKAIADLETQTEKQRHQLKMRLRALYKLSGESFLGVVFSQASVPELDETLRFLKIITENDYRLIRNYQGNIASYLSQRKKLKRQVARLVGIEKRIKKQETLLSSEHVIKSQIVTELDSHRALSLNRMKSLRDQTKELKARQRGPADDLEELLKPSIFEQKGLLQPPVAGQVVQDFGLIADNRYKVHLSHKGWRYDVSRGEQVAAIFDGNVIFAEKVSGYGSTIVIDHGDHYYSIYSHISRMKAKTGDIVKRGQIFAEAGGPTRKFDGGLYFEIRHFSEPENPAQWIAKSAMVPSGAP
jgi:septal ring factor EnvC (AmiA/AmiB activator)